MLGRGGPDASAPCCPRPAAWSERAGFAPEVEKAELLLLPQRPEDARVALRRPADVYLPALEGSPTALDLAITGTLRSETLAEAGRHALSAASAYAQLKATHLNTAQTCAAQGIRFRPMVAESTGAWEADASHILLLLSRGAAAGEGGDPGALHACLLQELCVAIRASHARAVPGCGGSIHYGHHCSPLRTAWSDGGVSRHESGLDLLLDWLPLCFAQRPLRLSL